MYGKCWPIYLGFMPCVLLSVWSCVECLWLEKQWSLDLYTLSLIASECTCSTSRWLNWRKCLILLWLLYQKQFSIFLVHLVSLKKYLYLCSLSGLIIFALINLVHIWKKILKIIICNLNLNVIRFDVLITIVEVLFLPVSLCLETFECKFLVCKITSINACIQS